AAKGKIQLQAQSDDIEITADKNIKITACKEKVEIAAGDEVLLTSGGGYIRLKGGNIEIHCPGEVSIKGASHELSGGTSLSQSMADLPKENGKYDQAFQIEWAGLGLPASHVHYRLKTLEGQLLAEGVSDEKGQTSLSKSLVPDGVIVEILKDKK
ncbi:DUF2345 domain-containing protein, partial [Iodobacter sp. CM08]|uniref:DUF2345 domain-containing protein n=1 Tax=Iodobacter sp. CM08 TaxID=3085902 RepID=UPI002981F7A9